MNTYLLILFQAKMTTPLRLLHCILKTVQRDIRKMKVLVFSILFSDLRFTEQCGRVEGVLHSPLQLKTEVFQF